MTANHHFTQRLESGIFSLGFRGPGTVRRRCRAGFDHKECRDTKNARYSYLSHETHRHCRRRSGRAVHRTASYQKLNDAIEITVFEAAPRLGGKVLTTCFEKSGIAFEVGTAELYDYSMHGLDPLRELVKKLGFKVMPFQGGVVILGDRILRSADDVRRVFGLRTLSAIRAFRRQCAEILDTECYYQGSWSEENTSVLSSMTFETLLQRVPDEAARRYLLTAVRSDLATESNSTNALNGVKNVLMDNPRYFKLYAIAGGLEQLIAKLAASLRAKILLRRRVNAISRSGEDYLVHWGGKRYPFDVVVLALPDYDLRRIEFEDRDLRHAISAHCEFYDRPGHYLRVTALFRIPSGGARCLAITS